MIVKDSIPIVSVILPVYNGEDHLTECINSILDQSFKDFEFIITDDASTDDTPQILAKFARQDTRIKIITHKINQKQTIAANTAIKNAKGKYLARMDADDLALPNRFEQQVKFMEENQNIGLLGSWVNIIDDNGKVLKIWHTHQSNGYLGWNLLFGTSFAHSSVMMRSDIAKKAGYYQSPEAEDYDLWSRIGRIAKVANIPEVLQQKRVWGGQLALKVPTETRDCVLQIMQKNINHLLNNSNLDLEMIRNIRMVSDKTTKIQDSQLIHNLKNILLQLYRKYLAKFRLTQAEKKKVSRDVFLKLNTLADWQSSVNIYKAIIEKLYLVYRFPKLYSFSLIQRNKSS